jgi:hypothetical protein
MAHVLTNGDYEVTVYGAIAPRYVRTDRNGTKIYHDVNCPRCAGVGESDNWWATGRTCYACGGSGKRGKPQEVKVYTPEYAAKLDARARAKAEAKAAEAAANAPSEAELLQRADEARRNAWQNNGFSRDGVAYVYQGDTYKFREAFRKAGARWLYRRWFSPVPVECGIEPAIVSAEGIGCSGYGFDPWDVIVAHDLPRW